jgi:hypothetical protein
MSAKRLVSNLLFVQCMDRIALLRTLEEERGNQRVKYWRLEAQKAA